MDRTDITIRNAPIGEVSPRFLQGMSDRMAVSFEKYGSIALAYPDDVDAIASLKTRLERYEEDGNLEWLMDIANFAMIEFMLPRHPQAHYDPEAASPGRTDTLGRNQFEKANLDIEVNR